MLIRRLYWALAGLGLLAACAAPPAAPPGYPAAALTSTRSPHTAVPAPSAYPAPAVTVPAAAPSATVPPTPASPATAATTAPSPGSMVYMPIIGQGGAPATAEPPAAVALPTETPPPWPEALAGQTASKLGLHAMGTSDPYVMEFVRRVKPRVVKAVGDFGWLAEVKAIAPETVTLGRVLPEQSEWIQTVDPALAGQAYVDINLATYQANPAADYWEGWNEFVPQNPDRMRWFAQFEAARACAMQARGLRAAVGGFSTGVPEYALMADFLPALEAAQRCGGIFHLHEYSSPTFDCGTNVNMPEVIPGAPAIGATAGPLALRYRIWYEALLKPRGLGAVPLVISELGIDGVQPHPTCGDAGGLGWKGYVDWWLQNGIGPNGPQAYVNVLQWYDAEMRRDPYVLGGTLFTANALNPDNEWHAFDLHEVLVPLAVYAAGQR